MQKKPNLKRGSSNHTEFGITIGAVYNNLLATVELPTDNFHQA